MSDRFDDDVHEEAVVPGRQSRSRALLITGLVLPPDAESAVLDAVLDDPERATAYAREHPDRQDVRIVAGATRAGSTYCALRLRAHDDDTSVVGGADLVPGLLELLSATLEDELDG